ncbi:cation transporting ATPase [Trichosporon asahii var. asahii CBS 8904]|uniref:Cation-transporting ATPase n=1 Tax=Trichosporon asahii var. asahii (strain CBS 8904) TaxID=1220162 RepID=K1VL30_TRIAC|nr:cation transporting ATPase [Trichosporon asahii var. asahii CBS 8904]
MSTDHRDTEPGGSAGPSGQNGQPRDGSRVEDWTDGATDQAIAIAIEQRDKENPPGQGDSMSGSLMTNHDGVVRPRKPAQLDGVVPLAVRHVAAAEHGYSEDEDGYGTSSRFRIGSRRGSRAWRRESQDQFRDYRIRGSEDYGRREDESPAHSPQRTGSVLNRIASFLGRREEGDEESLLRRQSTIDSRHSIESSQPSESSMDSWGYGKGDDDAESYTSSLADDTSLPPQSRPQSPNLPLVPLPGDGIFGESTAHFNEDEIKEFEEGVDPSRQTILLPDEDLSIRFTGYRTDPVRNTIWWILCICTLGILGLVGRWSPMLWVRFCGKETPFEDMKEGSWLVVETPYGDIHIVPMDVIDYPYPLSTVFPAAAAASAAASAHASANASAAASAANSILNGTNGHHDVEQGKMTWEEKSGKLRVMEYRYTRFALDPLTGRWAMIRDWRDPKWTSARQVAQGLDSETRTQRRTLMGDNVIDIKGKSLFGLLVDEVLHPFYVFQIASIALWSVDDYYYYAFAIALISATSILSTLIETKRTIERMREMSRFECPVNVLIDGKWQRVDCTDMVPGDIFDVSDPTLTVFPCDALLLSGDAIVNESMLTGESVPVSKVPVKDEAIRAMSREAKAGSSDIDADLAKHYLFSGTKIIRVRAGAKPVWAPASDEPVALAMVARTGFNTTKGALVRSMLFPKPLGFKFYRDSMNFIGVLAMIAGFGFAISAVQFIRIGIAWETILVRALDLITIVVPPALPATLTIGTTFAIERLRKSGIFCISPNRVNIGGKVNVVCFDKTGTLTEEGLDVLGVRTIDRLDRRFSELHSEITDVPTTGGPNGRTPLLYALATCHALKLIDGEMLGDPLDIKMFEYSGWSLDEGQSRRVKGGGGAERVQTLVQSVVRPPGSERMRMEDVAQPHKGKQSNLELGVIRSYEFVSALRRMTVIVKRLKSSSMEIYCKGAPEVMPEICDPDSFPSDYEDMLSYYTRNGFRVIAIAGKSVEGLTWLKAQRMRREVAEHDMQFLGFIVFENKLKPGTAPNIHTLRAAHIACRMVTGDNVRTAISVARECGLISHSSSVYIPTFVPGTGCTENALLDWSSVDDERQKLDDYTLKPITDDPNDDEGPEYQLALTGDVFKWMLEYAPLETMDRMLVKGVIFARMSPDEKAELVERLQALGYTVTFCGDGANDCGALKAADVGVSLSEAEASVAAPFTSRTPDISCVVEIIREGRCALVTSFSCFKYMALYSLIQFTTVTLLYSFASSLGDFQFLYIDLFIIIPIAVAMGRTLPYPKIYPKRPTASLVSKKVLTSIIGQTIINASIQGAVFLWVRQQPWYTMPPTDRNKLETFNYENTSLFLISCFQYILVAGVFSVGPPYRQPMYTNPSLMICLVGLLSFSTYILLEPSKAIAKLLDIIALPSSFKLQLLGIAIFNIVVCFGFERYAERPIARGIGHFKRWIRRHRKRPQEHHYKPVGVEANDDDD